MSAVAASSRSAEAIGLPPLRPVSLRFCPEEGRVEFLYDPITTQKAIPVAAAKLGAFIVSYCIRARIPMPRGADKDIRIGANALTLCFKTYYAEAPAPDDAVGHIRFSRVKG